MAFDVLVHITEDSKRGRIVQMLAAQKHVSPEQVVEEIIDSGLDHQERSLTGNRAGKSPAESLIGLFSSPEDAAMLDGATAIAYEGRRMPSTRDIGQ